MCSCILLLLPRNYGIEYQEFEQLLAYLTCCYPFGGFLALLGLLSSARFAANWYTALASMDEIVFFHETIAFVISNYFVDFCIMLWMLHHVLQSAISPATPQKQSLSKEIMGSI